VNNREKFEKTLCHGEFGTHVRTCGCRTWTDTHIPYHDPRCIELRVELLSLFDAAHIPEPDGTEIPCGGVTDD